MKMQHTVAQCNIKLIALLDKLDKLDSRDNMLPNKVDDCKTLARELRRETFYLNRQR